MIARCKGHEHIVQLLHEASSLRKGTVFKARLETIRGRNQWNKETLIKD